MIVVSLESAGIKTQSTAIDQAHALFGQGELLFQLLRQPDIVLIEKCDPLSSCLADSVVPGSSERHIIRREEAVDSRIDVLRDDGCAGIRRAVVPNDKLPVGK